MNSFSPLRRRGAAALLAAVLAVPMVAVTTASAVGTTIPVAAATSAVKNATDADQRAAASVKRAQKSEKSAAAKVTAKRKAAKKAAAKRATAAKNYTIAKKKYVAAKKNASRRGGGGANISRAKLTKTSKALKSATAQSRRAKKARSKALSEYTRAKTRVADALAAKTKTAKALTKAKSDLAAAMRRPKPTPTPTAAPKPTPTPTAAPKPTSTPTAAPEPTSTPTAAPKPTSTPTAAPKPTSTPTAAPEPTTPPSLPTAVVPTRTAYTGPMTVWTAGAVIENKVITGELKIRANNVTIRNSLFVGPTTVPTRNYFMLWNTEGTTGLKVIDSEFRPTIASSWMNGVIGAGFTLERVKITNVIDQVTIKGDDVTIKDSVFEGNLYYKNDPNHGGKESHADNVQIQSGKRITITGSTMRSANNATVQVTQALGAVADLNISRNFLDHGGCTINITEGSRGYGPLAGVKITDNEFGTNQRIASCAVIRPKTTVITATGNTFTDGRTFAIKNG
ncbi:hypothetical protein IGS67_01850 [Flavimobilis sp. GY10621]|uniref:Right handed beta helix region n=1 Tax=Flavimobilis rhizosphaerae TaxID=2775421 RepID=A0ABR9DM77_9MICO|nr:hypothetical protein [Flavimobilis rhizosphaerae]MBD9698237.1 hypothetical protein [Flavimobilis rhizosphaerae]